MAQPVPNKCPLSGGPVEVTEVSCLDCDVQIRGHFTLSKYDRLEPEQMHFMEAFLRSRGVIRDVEAALGLSYPTVRARLDSLLNALGFNEDTAAMLSAEPSEAEKATKRKEILAAIDAGTMNAETGLQALQSL